MPGYDAEKDKVLKKWENDLTGLVISIRKYGNSIPKVQIGPRVMKKDGNERTVKAGRLTIEDIQWIYDIIDEIKDELSDLAAPE